MSTSTSTSLVTGPFLELLTSSDGTVKIEIDLGENSTLADYITLAPEDLEFLSKGRKIGPERLVQIAKFPLINLVQALYNQNIGVYGLTVCVKDGEPTSMPDWHVPSYLIRRGKLLRVEEVCDLETTEPPSPPELLPTWWEKWGNPPQS